MAPETSKHQARFPVVVTIVKAVSMSKEKFLSVYLASNRFCMKYNSALLHKIISAPLVMITLKEMHLHSSVGQFAHLTQESSKSPWHDICILKPKVKHIAKHIHSLSLVFDCIKKVHKSAFMRTSMLNGTRTEVRIQNKVYILHNQLIRKVSPYSLYGRGNHLGRANLAPTA